MTTTTRVGSFEVIQLNDAVMDLAVPASELFPSVRDHDWSDVRRRYPTSVAGADRWRAAVHCHVVRSATQTILLDTGLGSAERFFSGVARAEGALPERLRDAGIGVDEVDVVLHTHLHADHVGWNVAADGSPTFVNARYVAHEADWAMSLARVEAGEPNAAYVEESLLPLQRAGVLELVDDPPVLEPGITAIHAPGHTPGHLCLRIADAGESLWLVGDVLAHPMQIADPSLVYAYDRAPEQAVATRRAVLAQIADEGARVAACHPADPGFHRLPEPADAPA